MEICQELSKSIQHRSRNAVKFKRNTPRQHNWLELQPKDTEIFPVCAEPTD